MPVLLCCTSRTPHQGWEYWVAVGEAKGLPGEEARRLPNLASELEAAVDATSAAWLAEGRRMGEDAHTRPDLAHTPVCAPNVSDFGVMLAWTALVDRWGASGTVILLLCDDPWLFRHLMTRAGVVPGHRPRPLWPATLRLGLRGFVARAAVAVRVAWAHWRTRNQRHAYPKGAAALMVYGHPASRSDGYDGYFGPLALALPALQRVFHVDCDPEQVAALGHRAFSLHAWGRFRAACMLPFVKWQMPTTHSEDLYWLVRRAVALEGGTGQAAAIQWQQVCQEHFVAHSRPRVVSWPWENHAWERQLVVACRRLGVGTVGFQHTPFGRQEFNFHAGSNSVGLGDIPDTIMATGSACLEALATVGYPRERLKLGGSLRFVGFRGPRFAPDGPVLVALPFHPQVARQMVKAAAELAEERRVLVKVHPMAPSEVTDIPERLRTSAPFADQPPLAAVLFAASSIGLEALASGVPTVRFLPQGAAGLNPLPHGVSVIAADAPALGPTLRAAKVSTIDISRYYAPADVPMWRSVLLQ